MTIREEIIDYLKGSYTETGMEKWFNRPRSALMGKTPNQILEEGSAYEVSLVLDLAKWLRYS